MERFHRLTVLGALFGVFMFVLNFSFGVLAQDELSPIGRWRTIDDKTGEAKAIVEIHEEFNALFGTVIKVFPRPGRPIDPVCEFCGGDRKDKPIKGMTIIWDMRKADEEWGKGKILDPESGKIYSARMWLTDNGSKLTVRGFIGFSMLGRSQVWIREP